MMKEYMCVDNIGKIYVLEEITFYDKLLTFTCENEIGHKFIAICIELDENERWFFLPISDAKLIRVLRGEITAYKAFKDAEQSFVYEVIFKDSEYVEGKGKILDISKILDNDLPDTDVVFDIYKDDKFSIKDYSVSEISKLSQLEKRDIIEISLLPQETHIHEIDVLTLGNILTEVQSLINIIAYKDGLNGRIPPCIKEENKLSYCGDFAASFGIRLKSHNLVDVFNQSNLQTNISKFLDLLKSKNNKDKLSETLNGLNPLTISKYKKLLNTLNSQSISLKVNVAYPEGVSRKEEMSSNEIEFSLDLIEKEFDERYSEIEIIGTIVAIDTKKKTFKIDTSTETISGEIDEKATSIFKVPQKVRASIGCTTKLININKNNNQYTLLNVQFLE
ncbi:MAG: DUF6575 domain-containing protein [Clostridium sp.]